MLSQHTVFPSRPVMLITSHGEVLPACEEQALVAVVAPSVFLPRGFQCSHTTPDCSIVLALATSCRLRSPGTSATLCCWMSTWPWLCASPLPPSFLACSHHHLAVPVLLHPREHPECFPASSALGPLQLPLELLFTSPRVGGKGFEHSPLCQEGCPRHPSSPEAGSCRGSTYLRQHSPGDTHTIFLLSSCRTAQLWTGGRYPMAVLLRGPASLPRPRQGCGSRQPPPAAAISGQQLQGKAPGSVTPFSCLFSPSSSARTHRNHVCLTIYKTFPSCCCTVGAGQCPAGPRPPYWAQPFSARELSALAGAAVEVPALLRQRRNSSG